MHTHAATTIHMASIAATVITHTTMIMTTRTTMAAAAMTTAMGLSTSMCTHLQVRCVTRLRSSVPSSV